MTETQFRESSQSAPISKPSTDTESAQFPEAGRIGESKEVLGCHSGHKDLDLSLDSKLPNSSIIVDLLEASRSNVNEEQECEVCDAAEITKLESCEFEENVNRFCKDEDSSPPFKAPGGVTELGPVPNSSANEPSVLIQNNNNNNNSISQSIIDTGPPEPAAPVCGSSDTPTVAPSPVTDGSTVAQYSSLSPSAVATRPANPFKTPFYRVVTDGSRRATKTQLRRTAAEVRETLFGENGMMPVAPMHSCISLARFPNLEVSIFTDIGGRRSQEDRFTYCPCVAGRPEIFFLGIFDGTVGDFASDTVKELVVPHLTNTSAWPQILGLLDKKQHQTQLCTEKGIDDINTDLFPLLAEALDEMYLLSDSELIESCGARNLHYASSTSVVALVVADCCCIGHLGDSRAALGHFSDGQLYANFVTDDHKPNQPHERLRIRQSGGSVEYLHNHNNKPFIRGGDFTVRKNRGGQPMQLQYSRAFGGKDLKMYGLSNEPDVLCFKIEPFHSCLILASDGIWDVLTAGAAVKIAVKARLSNCDPACALVHTVLSEQQQRHQAADNVTAAVLFFDTSCNSSLWTCEYPKDNPPHIPILYAAKR